MSEPNRIRCPRCRRTFRTEWGAGDFQTCPVCKMDFLIKTADVVEDDE